MKAHQEEFWGLDAPFFNFFWRECEGIRTPRKVKGQDHGLIHNFFLHKICFLILVAALICLEGCSKYCNGTRTIVLGEGLRDPPFAQW